MAIKHPEAFECSPSAGFDGLYYWDWMKRAVARRGIEPCDTDAKIEINGFFLLVESKAPGVEISRGQGQAIRAELQTGLVTYIYVRGKQVPTWWRWESWEEGKSEEFNAPIAAESMLNDMSRFVARWADDHDRLPADAWRHRLIEAANRGWK